MKSLQAAGLGAFILALPVAVEIPAARDSGGRAETRVTVAGGMGRYAIIDRGCEGQVIGSHPHEFEDLGLEARHVFGSGVAVGARGGLVQDRARRPRIVDPSLDPFRDTTFASRSEWTNLYANPSIGLERDGVGIGIGVLAAEPELRRQVAGSADGPTFHLRLGSLDAQYLKISYLEAFPLNSGGGVVEIGVGGHADRSSDYYVGLAGGEPFDGPGLVVGLERRVQEHLAVSGRARLGHSGGEPQFGVALGISAISAPRRPPIRRERVLPMGSAWGLGPRRREPQQADSLTRDSTR